MTASMQGVLLYLAIYYEIRAHSASTGLPKSPHLGRPHLHANGFGDDNDQENDAVSDATPLLRPGGVSDPHPNYDTNRG
jgi:hypothetical protein